MEASGRNAMRAMRDALRFIGGDMDMDGSNISLPPHLFNPELDSHFGVLTIRGEAVSYGMIPPAEVERIVQMPGGDVQFEEDTRRALRLFRDGTHHAIILCSLFEGPHEEAYTKLCVFPSGFPSSPGISENA